MKRVFEVVLVVLVFFFSCSEPLDARKVESHKIVLDFDSGEPVEVMAPKGAVESPGAEPEDMLGLYTVYSRKVRAENFAVEVEFTTLSNVEEKEIVEEKLEEIKTESDLFRVINKRKDGFLYETKEINGDLNYGFLKLIVTKNKYAVIFPEPKPEGNTSLEEAIYMYDVLNRN